MVVEVAVTETLRLLPIVFIRVTDENGFSAGPGLRGINLLGHGSQVGVAARFGGETGVSATVDATTITPGTWTRHLGFSYSSRQNTLYDFDERATSVGRALRPQLDPRPADGRGGRRPVDRHGRLRGVALHGWQRRHSDGWRLRHDRHDRFVHESRATAGGRKPKSIGCSVTPGRGRSSWTAGGITRLADRHGLGIFSLVTLQTGEVGTGLPEYLQFALGGANTVRGWSLGSRTARNQFIGTLEYTYVLQPVRSVSVAGVNVYAGLQLAGFGDLGLAWNDRDDLTGSPALDGYGAGLRVQVPFVDLIRLDVAWGEPDRRHRLLRRVAQGRPAAPASALTVTRPSLRALPAAPPHQPDRAALHARC